MRASITESEYGRAQPRQRSAGHRHLHCSMNSLCALELGGPSVKKNRRGSNAYVSCIFVAE